jgi:epsilon-lactone hydrolase
MTLPATTTSRLVLSGDSAGGALTAGLAALTAGTSIHPVGLVLLSPWLDLRVENPSYRENAASDPLFSAQSAREAAALYLQGFSPSDKLASPLLGPVESFPPTFINVGTGEVLADDARRLHKKLHNAGIYAQLQIVEEMEHVAVTRDLTLPGAGETFEALAAFVDSVLMPKI